MTKAIQCYATKKKQFVWRHARLRHPAKCVRQDHTYRLAYLNMVAAAIASCCNSLSFLSDRVSYADAITALASIHKHTGIPLLSSGCVRT
eukprot:scaffold6830_cov202-Prasinococcus_capsulatus_cf.AAC.4